MLALPAFCVPASADIVGISDVFDVYFGTATFNASQTTAVTCGSRKLQSF
jgi:hypothetical protein